MKNIISSRRKFLEILGSISALPLLSYCKNPFLSEPELFSKSSNKNKIDLLITGSEEEIASTIKNQFALIEDMAKNYGKEKIIAYYDNNSIKKLSLEIIKGKLAAYPYLRITKMDTNESVNVLWGIDGIYPSLKFVDDNGNLLVKDNQKIEFAIRKNQSTKFSSIDWLELGIKIFAFALLIWLGATVLKYVIAAISFVAFNALVLGIIIAGVALIAPIIKWIINTTHWSIEDIKYMFLRAIEEIKIFLYEIQGYLLNP